MNRKWLRYFLFLGAGLVLSANAQLQFTNVSTGLVGLRLTNLFGVTCGSVSNSIFVAVGADSSVVTWTLTNLVSASNQNLNWVTNRMAGANGLYAAAFGGNQFLVTGDGNVVFSSTNAVNWTSNGMMFANSARAQGLAFNNGTFVSVASAPEIAWSTNATVTPWGLATITGLSYADSFRGVTAFNLTSSSSTNFDFAACGILGRLATSSDGGRDWATNNGSIYQPDLLGIASGIASDGNQKLVCVGANGAILTFINGGTLWASSTNGTSSLNAASYVGTNYLGTNYGFIAVGANGSVLTSADGAHWMMNSATDPTLKANINGLNGVFFATSGQFKGIGVLVGDHGTIILAGTPPQPPSDITPAQTNCAGEINFPLVVKFNTFDYPIGALVVDWSTNIGFSTLETNITTIGDTNYFVPPVVTTNITITNVYYVRIRDIRTGLSSTSIMVTNIVYEQPTIAGDVADSPICNGDSDAIVLNLTGDPPWTVMWSDGAVSKYTASPAFRYLSALEVTNVFQNAQTNYTFVITNLADRYCTAQTNNLFYPPFNPLASNIVPVTVNPRPMAAVISTNSICNGDPSMIQANLTGIEPWVVTWSDGAVSNYIASPAFRYLTALEVTNVFQNVQTNYTFTVTALSNSASGCVAIPADGDLLGAALVTVNPRPTAAVIGTNSICNGDPSMIQVNLTGIEPWVVTWSDGAVSNYTASPAFRYLTALEVTNVFQNVQTNYTFTVTALSNSASGCVAIPADGDLLGVALVTVNPRPTSVLTPFSTTICNDGTPYPLTNVLTGLGPWTLLWSSNGQQVLQPVTNEVPGPFTNTFAVIPTNTLPDSAFTNIYYVLAISNNATTCQGSQPGDIIGTNSVIVDPTAAPPTNNGNMTSCFNVAVPLSVSVPLGFTADWYSNLTLVASGTNVYVPPVPINLGTNSSLTNTYLVFARFLDPNLTNCYSPGTNVSLISLLCTNVISSIASSGTNSLISWSGNFVLQSATNLTPPVIWINVATGALGPNTWTNSMVPPPTNNFFRLYAPTN